MALVEPRTARLAAVLLLLLLNGCAPWQPSDRPVPGRSEPRSQERVVAPAPPVYEVRRGDTLYSIAFRYDMDWRNIARWNRIDAPYTIRPGQELRMSAPPRRSEPRSSASANRPTPPKPDPPTRAEPEPAGTPADPSPAPPPQSSSTEPSRTVAGVAWQWPTQGKVRRRYDASAARKGVGIAGSAGQPVHAAAGGEVVYSGTALIGYGELIIIKHTDTLLSAYGHNRQRLVAEGDRVGRGQKIAEMGVNDRREEMLHFEIRRDGNPVNPLEYLPSR